jgi:hypothetical protein
MRFEALDRLAVHQAAKADEERRYREALALEPGAGPWGVKVEAHYIADHYGIPRGFTEVHFTVRGHKFIYLLQPGDDFRSIHLQHLTDLNRPKVKSVPSITGKRADAVLMDDLGDYAYGLSA